MFNTDAEGMKLIAKLAKWKHPSQGPTGAECGRAIRLLATLHKKRVIYARNKGIKNEKQLLARLGRRGQFILNYEEHLGVFKNGVFVDDWSPFSWDLEGWWQIIDKYPRVRNINQIHLNEYSFLVA